MGKELTSALLGIIGGVAFFFGVLMATPFLSQTNIEYTNPQLISGVLMVVGGLFLVVSMIVNLLED